MRENVPVQGADSLDIASVQLERLGPVSYTHLDVYKRQVFGLHAAVDERYRARLNACIDKLIGEGRQVFVVCPKVEETDDVPADLKSAEEHAQVLQRTFPQHRVA